MTQYASKDPSEIFLLCLPSLACDYLSLSSLSPQCLKMDAASPATQLYSRQEKKGKEHISAAPATL